MTESKNKREEFELNCWRKYQLDWMMSHGYNLCDILNSMKEIMKFGLECSEECIDANSVTEFLDETVNDFMYESGFNGDMFACFNEFLDYEYNDEEYMSHLLDETEFEQWENYMEEYDEEDEDEWEDEYYG